MAAPKSEGSSGEGKTARERAYEEIVAEMKGSFGRYLLEYPERLGDQRNADAVAWSTRGLARLLRILDRYAIEELPNPAQDRKAR